MKYSGLRDKHLNVFINYAANATDKDSEHLENNITKAFINTLESLSSNDIKKVFKTVFAIDLPDLFSCKYYLQWSSTDEYIKQAISVIEPQNRKLLAFSPTGKTWGIEGSDTKDLPTMKKEIEEHYKKESPDMSLDELKEIVEDKLKEIQKTRSGNSIPDGLIIIAENTKPVFAIALENKKHDLDPYQLNNHLEKSLELRGEDKKGKIIYKKYDEIIDSIKGFNTYMTNSFIEYMIILGYYKSEEFKECFLADASLRKRLCIHFGKGILGKIKNNYAVNTDKGIDKRNNNVWRLHVKYRYLKEINLVFIEEKVYLSLAFGSMQNVAKDMYSNINPERFKNVPKEMMPKKSFHLQYFRGRNIGDSYIENNIDSRSVYEYIRYWKDNCNKIKGTTGNKPEKILTLYEKMMNDGIIETYDDIKKRLRGKKNDVLVVPELLFEPEWSYEEIGEMGEDSFIKEIEERINIALNLFDLSLK